jgi:hypothetical protein
MPSKPKAVKEQTLINLTSKNKLKRNTRGTKINKNPTTNTNKVRVNKQVTSTGTTHRNTKGIETTPGNRNITWQTRNLGNNG